MKTRILYTKFWHDNYISDLSIKEKLLFIYLTTNEQVNICGIYELPDRYIKFDLGLKQFELDKIKQKFIKDKKFLFIDGWVKIVNHDIYNKFVGEKNEKAKENELALIPIKIKEFRYPIDSVSTNGDTLNNINHNHNKKEGEYEGGEKEKKRGDIFTKTWQDFKEMRKAKNKKMTSKAEELILNELNKLATDEKTQVAILNQSIMNSWQGVFPLKVNKEPEVSYAKYESKKVSKAEAKKYINTAKEGIKILTGRNKHSPQASGEVEEKGG